MQYYLHEVSPFGHPRIKACEAAPRGFSQPSTSFIGVLRQGILYVRLTNFLRTQLRVASAYAGQSPSCAAALGASLRQRFRCSFTVLKYGSVRYSSLPCAASKHEIVPHVLA
jgi:hypothetical protein